MAQIQPLYLIPVVSFMQWHLQGSHGHPPREYTSDEVLELTRQNSKYAGIPDDELQYALMWAQRNVQATNMARMFSSSRYTDGTASNA